MLGALRSELDDSDTGMHQAFETLASLAGTVRNAYLTYRITPEKAGELLQELRLAGADGNEWTVGASTGGWFKRRGGGRWEKSAMPLGVSPAPGSLPVWLEQGIAGRLAEAERSSKEQTPETEETASRDLFAEGSINPFQRKSASEDTGVLETGNPRSSTSSGDIDWIYEEWENTKPLRGAKAPAAAAPPVAGVQRPSLPKDLPADLDPDRSLEDALRSAPAPVDRSGSDHEGGAPEPRKLNPEEYFLPPED